MEMDMEEGWLRERYEPRARHALGEVRFNAARGRGLAMSLDEAVEYALSEPAAAAHPAPLDVSVR
jgi:hypothetical protein